MWWSWWCSFGPRVLMGPRLRTGAFAGRSCRGRRSPRQAFGLCRRPNAVDGEVVLAAPEQRDAAVTGRQVGSRAEPADDVGLVVVVRGALALDLRQPPHV